MFVTKTCLTTIFLKAVFLRKHRPSRDKLGFVWNDGLLFYARPIWPSIPEEEKRPAAFVLFLNYSGDYKSTLDYEARPSLMYSCVFMALSVCIEVAWEEIFANKLGRVSSHSSNRTVLVVEKPNERESDDETYRLKKIVLLATLSNESFAKLTAALLGPTKKVRCFSSCNLF